MFKCHIVAVGLVLLSALASCASQPTHATAVPNEDVTVTLTGTPGAQFRAFYIADGNRSDISGAVPLTLRIHHISLLAIAKQNTADEIKTDSKTATGSMSFGLFKNDDRAAILQLADGFSGSYVSASALAAPKKRPHHHQALLVRRHLGLRR